MQSLAQWREQLARIDFHDDSQASAAVGAFAQSLGPQDHALVPEMVEMLQHPHRTVRWAAVAGLQAIGLDTAGVLAGLLQALEDEEYPVRSVAAAALALVAAGNVSILERLLADSDDDGRVAAKDGLRAALPGSIATAIACLRSLNPRARRHAADALYEIGPAASDAIPTLLTLTQAADAQDRAAAASALGSVAERADCAGQVVDCLLDMLRDESWNVRHCAATSLSYLGSAARKALPLLEELARSEVPSVHGLDTRPYLEEMAKRVRESQTAEDKRASAD
jgi:HEAT repeat protein